ncbi:hypothetical protein D3C71_1766390 [compost metagenome]
MLIAGNSAALIGDSHAAVSLNTDRYLSSSASILDCITDQIDECTLQSFGIAGNEQVFRIAIERNLVTFGNRQWSKVGNHLRHNAVEIDRCILLGLLPVLLGVEKLVRDCCKSLDGRLQVCLVRTW